MIRLTRRANLKLEQSKQTLTESYQESLEKQKRGEIKKASRVWDKPYIKGPLFEMSHRKCAYCESKEGRLEVEHFLCRSKHPELVAEWANLLPACHKCNAIKGETDCCKQPMVDPSRTGMDPKDYLIYRNTLFYKRSIDDEVAENTRKLLMKRCTDELSGVFTDMRSRIDDAIDGICDKTKSIADDDDLSKNSLAGIVIELFRLAQREHAYSAVYASMILGHPSYSQLKQRLIDKGVWNGATMDPMENDAKAIALL